MPNEMPSTAVLRVYRGFSKPLTAPHTPGSRSGMEKVLVRYETVMMLKNTSNSQNNEGRHELENAWLTACLVYLRPARCFFAQARPCSTTNLEPASFRWPIHTPANRRCCPRLPGSSFVSSRLPYRSGLRRWCAFWLRPTEESQPTQVDFGFPGGAFRCATHRGVLEVLTDGFGAVPKANNHLKVKHTYLFSLIPSGSGGGYTRSGECPGWLGASFHACKVVKLRYTTVRGIVKCLNP